MIFLRIMKKRKGLKMKNKGQTGILNALKYLLLLGFVIGIIVILLFPFSNQPISMVIDTSAGTKEITYSSEEIQNMHEFSIEIPNIENETINEIRLYRKLNSVCVDKLQAGNLFLYATLEKDKIIFNDETCEIFRQNSKSFFMERLILSEVLLIVFLFIWILLNALSEKIDPDNRNNHGPIYEIKKFISEIKNYGVYMVFAANTDLKAEVANSYLNRLWWLLEPFFNMLVYVIVFGRVMGNSIENYATYVFSALLMWTFFNKTINYSVKCVRNNRDIVTKVYVPKHVLLISNMILNFFKLLFSLIVLIPMLIIFKVHIGIGILWIIPAYLLMIILSFGAGMIFLHFGVYIDDLSYAVGILLQMLMFLSGIFYDVIISLPTPLNTMMLCVNPVAMFIDTMRNALLNNLVTNVPLIVIWLILSVLVSYIGIHIVYKNENGYVKVV